MFGIGMQELLLILIRSAGHLRRQQTAGNRWRAGSGAIRNFRRASSEPDEIDITPGKDKKPTSGDDAPKA